MPMSPRLLRPRASGATHPEAASWATRVVTNGGTVGSSTLAAVSKFCRDIDAAGIRNRFVRLNLFCGAGLEAALVPLYRGQSRTGTQFGNTTDTNSNFVSGDYIESGSSGGLFGNGTNKRLNTGFALNDLGSVATGHVAAWKKSGSTASLATMIGVRSDASSTSRYNCSKNSGTSGAVTTQWGKNAQAGGVGGAFNDDAGLLIASRESSTDLKAIFNGVQTGITQTASTVPDASSAAFFVFCDNLNTVPQSYWPLGLCGYSVGLSLTTSQASSYYTAMLAFQTALGRQA